MARREWKLTTSITIDDKDGASREFDLIRIESIIIELDDASKRADIVYGLCKDDGIGNAQWAGGEHENSKKYEDAAFDTLHGKTSAGAGEIHFAKIEDQVYLDLAAELAIGAGAAQDYSF